VDSYYSIDGFGGLSGYVMYIMDIIYLGINKIYYNSIFKNKNMKIKI
jgi:hypothetical protein